MEERLRILEMVREGKLTVEEADRLLAALQPEKARPAGRGRLVRVRVTAPRGRTVNFEVPLSLADLVLHFLPRGLRITANGQEVDVTGLLADLRESGASGKILDVTDHRGSHIEITVD